jgi:hypothetical protein
MLCNLEIKKLKIKNYFIIQDEERMTVNDTITMVLVKEL